MKTFHPDSAVVSPPAKKRRGRKHANICTWMLGQDQSVAELDLVTAAKDILNLNHLTKKSFTICKASCTFSAGSEIDGFFCVYSNLHSNVSGVVVDYGTSMGDRGLNLIGGTDFVGLLKDEKGVTRRIFRSSTGAYDHMLCAIILFHSGEHADRKRAKMLTRAFRKLEITETMVGVKKQNAKAMARPLFFLAKHDVGAYLVFPVPGLDPLVLPFSCRSL